MKFKLRTQIPSQPEPELYFEETDYGVVAHVTIDNMAYRIGAFVDGCFVRDKLPTELTDKAEIETDSYGRILCR